MKNFLQSNNGYTLTIANAVFYQSGFLSGKYSSYLEAKQFWTKKRRNQDVVKVLSEILKFRARMG